MGTDLGGSHGGTLAGQCRWAARTLHFAVPCPRLLPEESSADQGPSGGACPNLSMNFGPGCDGERRYSFASIGFPTNARVGHLVVIGAPTVMSAKDIINSPVRGAGEEPVTVVGTASVKGHRAQVVRVPFSSATAFGEHLVLVWTVAGHTYALGFHGLDPMARRLDLAVAASVTLVKP
jgi:hypothetical protein